MIVLRFRIDAHRFVAINLRVGTILLGFTDGRMRDFFDKMRFSDLRLFKFYQRGVMLKNRSTASRKSVKRCKFFFVTFKFFRQRYKFSLEKPNKKGTPHGVSLYSTQRYNISHRNPNCINIRLTFSCSEFGVLCTRSYQSLRSLEVIALRAGSYCATRRSYRYI